MSASTSGSAWTQSPGGKGRRPGGGSADDAQGAAVGDPVGIDVGGFGGLPDQGGDGVVDGQPGPNLLVDKVGQP